MAIVGVDIQSHMFASCIHHSLSTVALASLFSSVTILQPSGLGHVHAAKLGSPAIERLLRDIVLPAYITDIRRILSLVEYANNLFFCVALAFHNS